MKIKETLIRDTIIIFSGTMLGNIAQYLFHIFMSRMLGPAEYGVLGSLLAVVMILGVPMLTTQTITAKYVAEFYARSEFKKITYLIKASMVRFLVLGALISLLFIFLSCKISQFLKIDNVLPVIILGFVVGVSLITPISLGVLQGLQKFYLLGFSFFLQGAGRLLVGVPLVWIGMGVNGAMSGVLITLLLILAISFLPVLYSKTGYSMKAYPQSRGEHWKRLIGFEQDSAEIKRYFIPVSIALLSFAILTNVDIIIVKHYFSPQEAGLYSAVAIIGRGISFLPVCVATAMLPRVSKKKVSGENTKSIFFSSLALGVLVLLLAIAFCMIFSDELAKIFGPDYLGIKQLVHYYPAAIAPISLIYIFLTYHIGLNRWAYLIPLILTTITHISLLTLFHNSLIMVLRVIGISGAFVLLSQILYFILADEVKIRR